VGLAARLAPGRTGAMKIRAELVYAEELQPGDLFSTAGPDWWDTVPHDDLVVGERVYIRMATECPDDQRGVGIYRITIEREGGQLEA
jgi:hypothetical protein